MNYVLKPINYVTIHQCQILTRVLRLSYSTVGTEASISENVEAGGLGFTAEELANAKPYTDIPSPKSYPIVGNLFAFKPFGDLDLYDRVKAGSTIEKCYGDILRLSLPMLPALRNIVQLLDPNDFEIVYRNEGRYPTRDEDPFISKYRKEHAQSLGLFMSSGEEWWRFRQPLNPVMMKVNAAKPYVHIQDCIGDDLIEKIKMTLKQRDDNLHPMVMEDIVRYALESVCAIVFDRRLGCLHLDLKTDSWQEEFINSINYAVLIMTSLNLNPTYKLLADMGYKRKKYRKWEKSMDFVTNMSLKLIQESKDAWLNIPEGELKHKFLFQLLNIENLSVQEKATAMFDMILAALDTTAYTTLTNCFFLAKYPAVQERLFAEVNRYAPRGTPLTASALGKMRYLQSCIKETARKKPIGFIMNRTLTRDIVVKGYRIPKGTMMFMEHQYASNSEKYVNDPETYNPDRWLRSKTEDGDRLHPFLVLPFGFGPRMCIGKRFAEQELEVALIKIVQNFHIDYVGENFPLLGIGMDKIPMKLDFKFTER